LIAAVSTLIVWRTKVHILWLLGTGALIGAFFLA
jgi:chromate transporter